MHANFITSKEEQRKEKVMLIYGLNSKNILSHYCIRNGSRFNIEKKVVDNAVYVFYTIIYVVLLLV